MTFFSCVPSNIFSSSGSSVSVSLFSLWSNSCPDTFVETMTSSQRSRMKVVSVYSDVFWSRCRMFQRNIRSFPKQTGTFTIQLTFFFVFIYIQLNSKPFLAKRKMSSSFKKPELLLFFPLTLRLLLE